jgi:hypothetical protein
MRLFYPAYPNLSINFRYDGKEIGAYIEDAIRNLTGAFGITVGASTASPIGVSFPSGVFRAVVADGSVAKINFSEATQGDRGITFNAANIVPTANENRPASISAYICIKY